MYMYNCSCTCTCTCILVCVPFHNFRSHFDPKLHVHVCILVVMHVSMLVQHVLASRCRSPAVESIAQFTVHTLSEKAPPLVSHEVATAWLLVCRQLYNTAEGLNVLLPYSIHTHIANCLNKVGRGTGTVSDVQVISLTHPNHVP